MRDPPAHRVRVRQPSEELGELSICLGPDDKVPMVGQDAVRQNADRVSRVRFDDDALERLEVGVFAEECGYSRPIGSGHDTPARRVHFTLLEAWARTIAGAVTTVKTCCVAVSSPALANRGYELRLIQDSLGHRDPRHTLHFSRVAGSCLEEIWS